MTPSTAQIPAPSGTLSGTSIIGGADATGGVGEVAAVDPRSGATLDPVYRLASAADVDHAAELAWEAFASYRATSPEARAVFLETVADNIDGLGQTLTDRVTAETGIPAARVLGETARTSNQLRLFATVLRQGDYHSARIDSALPDRTPLPRADIRLRKIPLGPVAVFGASNFPLAFSVAGGDTAAALAAGAPVIVKAHSAHPGTSELVGRAIASAVASNGLHPGVFSLLYGTGEAVGIPLVTHPRVKAVGFTGSRSGGVAITRAAADRPEPIPVFAEMSSINPVFVLPRRLENEPAALGAQWVASVLTGVGQLCTSPGLVFLVAGPGADAFVAGAGEAIAATQAAPMLTAGIASAFDAGAGAFAQHAGVRPIAAGSADPAVAVPGLPQLYVTDAATFAADERLRDEVFGPAALAVIVDDVADLPGILAGLEGQLTVTLHTDGAEPGAAELLDIAELRAGRVLFNGWPTGVEVVHSMVHGGPFPATSNSQSTSVGTLAIERFLRPVSYQNVPEALLPAELQPSNPLGIRRLVDGESQR